MLGPRLLPTLAGGLVVLGSASGAVAGPLTSSKRGLIFVPNKDHPQDNQIWTTHPSDLSWYYNYQPNPSPVYDDIPQSEFEFVPMLWGAPPDVTDTSFVAAIKNLVHNRGVNITNVLTFNEPDGPNIYGGSDITPAVAAQVWVSNVIPLQEMGLRVSLPACTGAPTGIPWLHEFLRECSKLVTTDDSKPRNCTYDFVTVHWYGNFEGLASHLGSYSAAFPNKTMWITEYNYNDQDLASTQYFYNTSAEYFDRLDFVERYSLFGAFRSHVSNVGPNAAMLNTDGELTDIGAWYLGRESTGVDPLSGTGAVKDNAAPHDRKASGVAALASFLGVGLVALLGF